MQIDTTYGEFNTNCSNYLTKISRFVTGMAANFWLDNIGLNDWATVYLDSLGCLEKYEVYGDDLVYLFANSEFHEFSFETALQYTAKNPIYKTRVNWQMPELKALAFEMWTAGKAQTDVFKLAYGSYFEDAVRADPYRPGHALVAASRMVGLPVDQWLIRYKTVFVDLGYLPYSVLREYAA